MNHDMSHQNHGRHGLLMLLCCLIPLVILGIVYGLRLPLNGVVGTVVILLCPLSHLIMMATLRDHGKHAQSGQVLARDASDHDTAHRGENARSGLAQ